MSDWDGWRGRRVFITGHTGFKGSWMALWLTQLSATVCGYALEPPSQPSLFDVARVAERIEDIRADICDPASPPGCDEGLRAGCRLPHGGAVVEWSQQWQAGRDMQQFTLDQIAEYQDLCPHPLKRSLSVA